MATTVELGQHTETTTLAVSGALLMVVGGTWWAFDANPSLGRVLIAAGVVALAAGLSLRGRFGTSGRRLALVFAAVVFAFAAFELWQAIVTIDEQRHATLG